MSERKYARENHGSDYSVHLKGVFMKILAIGEIIFDIFNGEAEIGGAPLNFCAHCAAVGAKSAIVSAVGGDSLGARALKHLEDFGVDTAFVAENGYTTGQCLVTVKNGNPEYNVLRPTAYDKIEISDDMLKKIKEYGADVFEFGTLIQRDAVSREAVNKILSSCSFSDVFCDVNLRSGCYDEESCRCCLENASILKISSEEEPLLAEFGLYECGASDKDTVLNICAAFKNIKLVLLTKGENGSIIYDKTNGKFYDIPAVETEVVATVGAGDSYSAAFLCEYFKNGDIEAAGKAGAELSAFVVAHREAVPSKA